MPWGDVFDASGDDQKLDVRVTRGEATAHIASLVRDPESFQPGPAHVVADQVLKILATLVADGARLLHDVASRLFGVRASAEEGAYPQLHWVLFVARSEPFPLHRAEEPKPDDDDDDEDDDDEPDATEPKAPSTQRQAPPTRPPRRSTTQKIPKAGDK
jgi:hypothetical protein